MATSPNSAAPPRSGIGSLWHRISEGRKLDDLWTHFVADARASYGFYGRDVDWEKIQQLPRWRRPFHVAKEFFWALLLKMTPARRVLLVIGLVLIMCSAFTLRIGNQIFLDLEIAREIQLWLVPSEPPKVEGADIAFATRPQNSVAGDYYDAFYPEPGSP